MYSPAALASPFGSAQRSTRAYRQVGIETGVAGASAHQLVQMLLDGLSDVIAQAKGALAVGDIEAKCRTITRAVRIVDEGLKASLDFERGSGLAQDLSDLYGYITLRLTQANLRNDAAALDECLRLIQPLREAWRSIAPQTGAAAA
jgi:flagellar protein FliS